MLDVSCELPSAIRMAVLKLTCTVPKVDTKLDTIGPGTNGLPVFRLRVSAGPGRCHHQLRQRWCSKRAL